MRSTFSVSFLSLLLALIAGSFKVPHVSAVDWESRPLNAEDAIIEQELRWAERAMEGYKQKKGIIPTRSSIRAAHVHTDDWRRDSISLLQQELPDRRPSSSSLLSSGDDFEQELDARNLRGGGRRRTAADR